MSSVYPTSLALVESYINITRKIVAGQFIFLQYHLTLGRLGA